MTQTLTVKRWALEVPDDLAEQLVIVNGRVERKAGDPELLEEQRSVVRWNRATVAVCAPSLYGLVAGLLTLTPIIDDLFRPRYLAALIIEAPLLMMVGLIVFMISMVVGWVRNV